MSAVSYFVRALAIPHVNPQDEVGASPDDWPPKGMRGLLSITSKLNNRDWESHMPNGAIDAEQSRVLS